MLKEDIVECNVFKGFYIVPNKPLIAVNQNGEFVHRELGNKITLFLNKIGYYTFTYFGETVLAHRLIADTFLVKPNLNENKRLFVNHKDGNKLNNNLNNLEWCTPQANAKHAYKNGLRKDNVVVLCKDLRNDQITRFYSIWECARFFGVNGAVIHKYVNSNNNWKVRFEHYLIIKEGEKWPEINDNINYQILNGESREVLILDEKAGKSILFESISSAADFLKIKADSLSYFLRKAKKDNHIYSINDFKIIYYNDYTKEEKFSLIRHNSKNNSGNKVNPRKPLKIEVTDLATEKKEIWDSSEIFANYLGVTKNTLQKHIYQNDGIWHKKYHIRYIPFK